MPNGQIEKYTTNGKIPNAAILGPRARLLSLVLFPEGDLKFLCDHEHV